MRSGELLSKEYAMPRILQHALILSVCALGALTQFTPDASAFCGFYVSGADQEMYNNATMVVMMRDGTKTVLSMRNNYEGPAEDFAMVVPVPQVLQEDNVKVIKDEVFDRVDKLAAPRLVEYFEQDPCYVPKPRKYKRMMRSGVVESAPPVPSAPDEDLGVKIEAQFDVGEYNVVILSAKESNGLQTWLEKEKYNIPKGAAPALEPYVEQGLYFFVAKVNPKKVKFEKGQAQLSPLRFHYDSKDFFLPVRLGLLNANGHQDLLVHILAKGQRYEVANYKNVSIPTNLIVNDKVRDRFGEFYAALLDQTLEQNPSAVITEYSWDSSSCDPCPVPALNPGEIQTLGNDVLNQDGWGWVLTRLHARYTADDLKEDLVFKAAPAMFGGRGTPSGLEGVMSEKGAKVSGSMNNFQGRYIMLNPWEGEIKCENPIRGRWGGPPASKPGATGKPSSATNTAFVKRGKFELAQAVVSKGDVPGMKEDAPALEEPKDGAKPADGADAKKPADDAVKDAKPAEEKPKASGCSSTGSGAPAGSLGLGALLLGLGFARRRRSGERGM